MTPLFSEEVHRLFSGGGQNLFHFGVALLLAVVQGAADEEAAFCVGGEVDEAPAPLPAADDPFRDEMVQGGVCGLEGNVVLLRKPGGGEERRAVREFPPQDLCTDFSRHVQVFDLPFYCVHRLLRLPPACIAAVCCNYTRKHRKKQWGSPEKNFFEEENGEISGSKSFPTYSLCRRGGESAVNAFFLKSGDFREIRGAPEAVSLKKTMRNAIFLLICNRKQRIFM